MDTVDPGTAVRQRQRVPILVSQGYAEAMVLTAISLNYWLILFACTPWCRVNRVLASASFLRTATVSRS